MSTKEEPKPKVNKPGNYPFRQQTLPAWKPILTPRTVLPTFAVFGIIFLAIGIALFVAANGVVEQQWDYTNCKSTTNSSLTCADLLADRSLGYTNTSNLGQRCRCEIPVSLTSSFDTQSTSLFYALTNFYQNHRRYVSSRWDPQLSGDVIAGDSSTCDPLYKAPNGLPYTPCGLIANSLFNDTIQLFRCDDPTCANRTRVPLSGSGISWPSDRKVKFRNPTTPGQLCSYPGWLNTSAARPPSWPVDVCVLGFNVSTYNPWSPRFGSSGYGYENEDFIVWMRTAALPDFRKLYRYVQAPLYDGKYVFAIDYNYPVTSFEGTKSIILSTSSWIGGHNIFLGTCYIVVACVSIAVVVFFAVLQHYKPRHISDDKFLRWEREH